MVWVKPARRGKGRIPNATKRSLVVVLNSEGQRRSERISACLCAENQNKTKGKTESSTEFPDLEGSDKKDLSHIYIIDLYKIYNKMLVPISSQRLCPQLPTNNSKASEHAS